MVRERPEADVNAVDGEAEVRVVGKIIHWEI